MAQKHDTHAVVKLAMKFVICKERKQGYDLMSSCWKGVAWNGQEVCLAYLSVKLIYSFFSTKHFIWPSTVGEEEL